MKRTSTVLRVLTIAGGFAIAAAARELPMLIERQDAAAYRIRGNGYSVGIGRAGINLTTSGGAASLAWRGAHGGTLLPLNPLATKVNYLTGNDRRHWRTGLDTYSRLRIAELYRGIDVVYYGTDRQLEYDFIVKPGADAAAIRFSVAATLSDEGELILSNGLRWKKPVAKQDGRTIEARFVAKGHGEFGLAVSQYDRTRELIIDPVLVYGTYLGGALADDARGVAADAAGNAYIVGSTFSTDFPGTSRGQTFGGQDAFVAKLNASGRALEWATYIGGTGADIGTAIGVDTAGNVYIAGQTASTNFPVSANAPQARLAGGSGVTDAFALKLAANGQSIVYGTYIGGSASDIANAITVDSTGAAYVAGRTDSTDFPSTTSATLPARGAGDGFVTKLSADGSAFVYSSLLGGFALDVVNAVAVDSSGSAYVTGETRSDNFPVTAAGYQRERKGSSDAFVAKLAVDGASLVYSSYFGGDGQESGRAIAVDRIGNAYFAGVSGSMNMPVSFNGAQRSPLLLPDAFAAKMDSSGSSLLYGTYIGGDAEDQANAIAIDANGAAYVAGQTSSQNFPLFNDGPLTATGPRGGFDGFVTRVSSGGNFFQFSSNYGGAGSDAILGLATDGRGRIWIAGTTDSTNLPTSTGALATIAPGATDGFIAQLGEIVVTVSPATAMLGARETQQFTAAVSNVANTAVRWSIFPETGSITQTGLYTAPDAISGSPAVTVSAVSIADGTKLGQATVTLVNRVTVSLTPADVTLQAGQTQQFTALVAGTSNAAVNWTLTPAIGNISASGLYSAPASFLNPATVTVRATSAAEPGRFATATVNLVLPPPAPAPVITAEGVTNAASFRGAVAEGGIAPGEIITIFGTNLGPLTPATLQLDGRGFVTTRLGGTRVLFDGTPGPMIATSTGQVSVVVPYGIEGVTSVAITVEFEGKASNQIPMTVAGSAPAIFTQNSSGSGAGSIIRQSGQLITASAPAGPGEPLTLFGTGDGATNPAGIDGKPTAAPLPIPKLPVKVVIDGVEIEPLYAGGAPGLVAGVLQVNFIVPSSGGANRRIRLRIGDKLSPDTVILPFR
ncbi:MAG: SBBP repeat-containing protein [Acidobacteria bacterium]|nr:SBBP repeat-containing protein [Acidobacteriota bacterium]